MSVRFEKTDTGYCIRDDSRVINVPAEKFEDIYFAVPTAPTHFFRLLTDDICASDDERKLLREMLDDAGLTASLEAVMEQIQALPEPS